MVIHPHPPLAYLGPVSLRLITVYPKKYAHGFVVLCFVVVMQSFIMNSHEVFIHIHQGCFAGTGAIVRLPQCQWSEPDGYGKISQCITTTKHSKAKTVCIHTHKNPLKCLFCYVWVQKCVWNFKGAPWNFTQIFKPIHRKIDILQGVNDLRNYDILELWYLKSGWDGSQDKTNPILETT